LDDAAGPLSAVASSDVDISSRLAMINAPMAIAVIPGGGQLAPESLITTDSRTILFELAPPEHTEPGGIQVIELNVNGTTHSLDIDPEMPLLWALRDHAGLTGTKFGCGIAECGSCTVHLDGQPIRSCITPVSAALRKRITTIEGLDSPAGKAVQAAWRELEVVQCGYCQSGQIMSAAALLERKKRPTDADIDAAMHGNLCRCAAYVRIRTAIKAASAQLG
jgi:isoquinoline 1-oxidoreductase alpha subunit